MAGVETSPLHLMPSIRVSVCLNSSQLKGQPQTALLVATTATTSELLQAAANKLRLKKKETARAQLFVWKSGVQLPRDGSMEGMLQNDDLVAISLGEPYAGPSRSGLTCEPTASQPASEQPVAATVAAPVICGEDDAGRRFASLSELWAEQAKHHAEYYHANDAWWDADGYGGTDDEQAMIGDSGSAEDVAHSQALLDAVRASRPQLQLTTALDGGAGIGRVTKHVLLRRCGSVCLLEPCARWLKQSRRYLGNKRAQRCTFVCERLEAHAPPRHSYDLIWLQWCLQYLVDADVVQALRQLANALTANGVLILKENRPTQGPACEFHVDVPEGAHGRYDVTRPDAHHRWLFSCAGLRELSFEHHDELTAWVLCPADMGLSGLLEAPSLMPLPAAELLHEATGHVLTATASAASGAELTWLGSGPPREEPAAGHSVTSMDMDDALSELQIRAASQ